MTYTCPISQAGPVVVLTETGGGAFGFLVDTTKLQGAHSSATSSMILFSFLTSSSLRIKQTESYKVIQECMQIHKYYVVLYFYHATVINNNRLLLGIYQCESLYVYIYYSFTFYAKAIRQIWMEFNTTMIMTFSF